MLFCAPGSSFCVIFAADFEMGRTCIVHSFQVGDLEVHAEVEAKVERRCQFHVPRALVRRKKSGREPSDVVITSPISRIAILAIKSLCHPNSFNLIKSLGMP